MNEAYLDDFFSFLRFKSVSTDDTYADDVARCAEWLARKLTTIGLNARIVPTERHPIVWARNLHRMDRRTVLIYGHYDVQPADPADGWSSPPFEPVVRNGRVFARGATDNKGQLLAHVLGLQETLANEELPVNLHLLIEGEEECGSGNLLQFLEQHAEQLGSDIVVVSDGEMLSERTPSLAYGLRGMAALEVRVTGPRVDLHSGVFGGAVANPITGLAQLLATLHDREGHIRVRGFHDDVLPLEEWEREVWHKIPCDVDEEILRETGVPSLFGEDGFSTLERLWCRPALDINGIGGGYQGAGSKTVIPHVAIAKLSLRLVPEQKPSEIIDLLENHLRHHLPRGLEIELSAGHVGPWYLMRPDSPDGLAAQRALRRVFGKDTALVRSGASVPIVGAFRKFLGAETLLVGLASPGSRMHSPDENFPIENLATGIEVNRVLLRELAHAPA